MEPNNYFIPSHFIYLLGFLINKRLLSTVYVPNKVLIFTITIIITTTTTTTRCPQNQFSSSPIRNAEVSHIISPSSCCSTSPSVSPIPWRRRSARHLSRRQASPPAATTNGERRYTASPVVSTKCQMSRRQLPAPAAQTPARRTINDACLFQSRGPAWSDNTTTTSSCGSVSVPPRTSRLASDIMVSTPAGSPTSGVEIDSSNATPEGCDISCIDMTNGASERSPREGAVYGAGKKIFTIIKFYSAQLRV